MCKQYNLKKKFLTVLLALTILDIFLYAKPSFSQTSYNWKWSPNVQFRLPAYGTVVTFDNYVYMDSFAWDAMNASKITFNHIVMDGERLDSWTVSVQNANITINDLFVQQTFQATVTAPTGTLTTTMISTGSYGAPKKVYVGSSEIEQIDYRFFGNATFNCWAYDYTNKNLWIKAVTSSSKVIKAVWIDMAPPEPPTPHVSAKWFYRADTHVVYNVTGYKMAETTTKESKYDTRSIPSITSIYYGVRVWVVHGSSQTELTQGTPVAVVTRSSSGFGLQSAPWDCPGYNGIVDAVMIKVYQRFDLLAWTHIVTFITSPELLVKFPSSSWIFSYYTKLTIEGFQTFSHFYWGANYGSGVTVQYDLPEAYEVQMWKLQNGDIIGWLFTPYTWFIGFAAYSLIFLLPIGLLLYNRFEDAAAAIIGLLLIGGAAGGILSAVVPQSGLQFCWVLFVLGLAALFYKLLKSL